MKYGYVTMTDRNGVQLTSLGAEAGTPRGLRIAERIAFDSNVEGRWEVYVIHVNGGKPRRLITARVTAIRQLVARWKVDLFCLEPRRPGPTLEDPGRGGQSDSGDQNRGSNGLESLDGSSLLRKRPVWNQPLEDPSGWRR